MLHKMILFAGLLTAASQVQAAAPEQTLPPPSQWLPANAVLAVELPKPKDLLDFALNPKVADMVAGHPMFKKAAAQPKFLQAMLLVHYLEMRLGTDWRTGLHALLDGGIAWAVTADGGSLLIVDAKDAGMLGKLHDIVVQFAKEEARKNGQGGGMTSAVYRGVTGWTIGAGEAHAIIGNRLLLANRPQVLKAAIDRREDSEEKGLSSVPAYQAARKAAGPGAAAVAYLNLATLKKAPQFEKILTKDENPMGALLLAGVREAVRQSNWLALNLRVEGQSLALEAMVDGRPSPDSEQAAFAWPKLPDEGALPNLSVPRMIAGMSLYRDLHAFYAAKDKLFAERTSGLIFFENMMGIFFSGRDLTEDIMAQPKPEVRVVVAGQEYDKAAGAPQIQIPAFAAIFRLKQPKQYADVIESAWQKAVGLINVTRGQKAEVGLVIDRQTYHDARYTVAYFANPPDAEKTAPGTETNFRASLVKMGDYLVLSSTEGLAKDLIDALQKETSEKTRPLAGIHTAIDFDGGQLSAVLEANRRTLVRGNMVEKGNSQEQAETEIGVWIALAKYLGQSNLTFGNGKQGPQAKFTVKLDLP
ncbi:MAG: DUF3352 domain-containing protein [Thermoguttaceae bacterium]